MVKDQIIKEIEKRVRHSTVVNYTFWSIGVTASPKACKKFHNGPPQFLSWQTQDSQEALEIRDLFIKKGMAEAMGQDDAKAAFVFIF